MKFKITMKDPDGFYDSVQDAAQEWANQASGIDDDEREYLVKSKREKLREILGQWFEYSEYLVVEIDTDANTIAVVKP